MSTAAAADALSLAADLFRHLSADKAARYRAIMDVFAAARRQYRLQLRPDEVQAEASWPDETPRIEEVNAELAQLAAWGNLESQPDTARVSSLGDYYRARLLYRLSRGGEAVEAALDTFASTLSHRAELQTVALEDIHSRLLALSRLLGPPVGSPVDSPVDSPGDSSIDPPAADVLDVAKLHETLRDLVRVFEGLAENAQAFMAGVARSIELQQADATAVVAYKRRLIEYLERFIGDLVRRAHGIGRLIAGLEGRIAPALHAVAEREARDAAPGDEEDRRLALAQRLAAWRERWQGLRGWFLANGHERPQSDLLRARARSAIPQLLSAIAALNERRSGRSDRSADFRVLARWFVECGSDDEAHRLARAAFALNPARHFSLGIDRDGVRPAASVSANTSWADAPPLVIHPRLREYGEPAPRGALPRVRDRGRERAVLEQLLGDESRQWAEARERLATGRSLRLSEIGELDSHAFALLLSLLGEALSEQAGPDAVVERLSADGTLHIRLEPLEAASGAAVSSPAGVLRGRDHRVTITAQDR